jgi:tetratricopeptide (TPR) repeat protein
MRLAGTVALVSLLAATATVRADLPADAPAAPQTSPQARSSALFQEGRTLLEAGDMAGACGKFDQAIRLDPDAAGTMLNLGLCNENLGKFKTALYWFRKALARATETNLPDSAQAARDHMKGLADKVPTIQVAFAKAVASAKVTIDGQQINPEDYRRLEIDPGHHVLEAIAPGKKLVHQPFDVVGKGGQTLTITMVAGHNPGVADRGHGRRMAGLGFMIGGVALLGGSGVVALVASNEYDRSASCKASQACVDKDNRARNLAMYGGNTLFFTGLAAAALGTYLYFAAPKPERIDRVVVAPQVGPTQLGLSLSGSF